MKRTFFSHRLFLLLTGGALLIFFALLLISTARRTSLAYDEVIYAPMGVLYWKTGDFRWNAVHPPLQKLISALPLLGKKITIPADLDPLTTNEWRAGYRLLFQSSESPIQLIFLSRLPSILISLLLVGLVGFVIYRRTNSQGAALLGAGAVAFDPLVLGNGALAMNDIFVTLFFFAAVIAFEWWLGSLNTERSSVKRAAVCGLLTGMAVSSKLTGILLGPIFFILLWRRNNRLRTAPASAAKGLVTAAFLAGVVFLSCYRFDLSLIAKTFITEVSLHKFEGPVGYLLGPVTGSAGWYYYPIATLIKTPVPLLFLWMGGALILWNDRKKRVRELDTMILPVLLIWSAALLSRNHFGLRYLLPAAPFLAVLVGEGYARIHAKWEKPACWLMVGLLAVEAAWTHPHHMAYFNQIAGGISRGYIWLDGSNQDWGQDLPALAEAIRKEDPAPSLLLGYWGSNRPEAWGIDYQDVYSAAITTRFREDRPIPAETKKEWLVVSATLINNPATKDVYRWLKWKQPVAFLGGTLFVYDITQDLETTLTIAQIYSSMGRFTLAKRQLERALFIKPDSEKLKKQLVRFIVASR